MAQDRKQTPPASQTTPQSIAPVTQTDSPPQIPTRSAPALNAKLVQALTDAQKVPPQPQKHPWRNFKLGIALYQPSNLPKK